MLINLRNALMAGKRTPTAKDYICDLRNFNAAENIGYGQHGTGNTWVDLISGEVATVNEDCEWHDKFLRRTVRNSGAGYMASISEDSYSRGIVRKFMTIEVVVKATAYGFVYCEQSYNATNQNKWNQHAYIWTQDNKIYLGHYSAVSCQTISDPATYCFIQETDADGNYTTIAAYRNGVQQSGAAWTSYFSSNIVVALGGGGKSNSGQGRAILGDLYAVRTSSRALTAQEIAANYALDQIILGIP